MKTKFKKIVAAVCAVATICSVSVVGASALTRRLYGDVNGDGVISMADAQLIQRYSLQLEEFDKYQLIAADVNGDGSVTLKDASMVQQLVAGVIDSFPVGDYFVY